MNVALYGAGGKRWAMTERGRRSLHRDAATLTVGPSRLAWDGGGLTIDIDEVGAPLPLRVRGRVRLVPSAVTGFSADLDAAGRHRWWPIAPVARVTVELDRPGLRWSGHGYLDTNDGDEPLERGFAAWDWSRAGLGRDTVILYDATRRDGSRHTLALRCDPAGGVVPIEPPPASPLPRTWWRIDRATHADPDVPARVVATLEDTPFYARSLLATRLFGETATSVHESLSLDRFAAPWVQLMLPFRMPKIGWR